MSVFHIAYRHVYVAVVQLCSLLFQFYHQLVVPAYEVELQVSHLLIRHYRCSSCGIYVRCDGSDSVGKQVVAYWDTCRLLRLRIKLIAHLTRVVQIYLSAILVGHSLDGVVLLTFLTFERQVCHQS